MTKCLNCGEVLTDGAGVRLASANFSNELPAFPMDDTAVWARCDACYVLACMRLIRGRAPVAVLPVETGLATATFGPSPVQWDVSGDIANGYCEEPQLVAEIKRVLLTPEQKDLLTTLDLTIEDCLNGRYNGTEERFVEQIYADWNSRIGRRVFGG